MNRDTKPKPFCFILMPFDHSFDDIYTFGIKGACEDADMYCERVDEQIFTSSMLDRIYNQIATADFIVAEMTGKNPNVFYEVGYAHALGKPTVLITQNAGDIPFDLQHFPHIVYESSIGSVRTELGRRLRHLSELASMPHPLEVGLELYLGEEPLSPGGVVGEFGRNEIPNTMLTLHNKSTTTYLPGAFAVGVIAPGDLPHSSLPGVKIVPVPGGKLIHMLPLHEQLFPSSYTTIHISLFGEEYSSVDLIVRVFTPSGHRDFPLTLRRRP